MNYIQNSKTLFVLLVFVILILGVLLYECPIVDWKLPAKNNNLNLEAVTQNESVEELQTEQNKHVEEPQPEQNEHMEEPQPVQHDTQLLWDHIKMLKQEDQWEIMFNCIRNELKNYWSTETFDATLGYMFELMEELSARFPQKYKSYFWIPEKGSRKELDSQARGQHFNIASKSQARETALKYDMLRDNLKQFIIILDQHYPIETSAQDSSVQEILRLKKKADYAKACLVKKRCTFISYAIVDPVLAEAEKYIFLSRGKWWTLLKPDYEELRSSVLLMANAFNNKWLFECDEETRFHFFRVQTKLKEMCARRRWEDFIALTTLADSWDPSKYRGAEAWWDGKDR